MKSVTEKTSKRYLNLLFLILFVPGSLVASVAPGSSGPGTVTGIVFGSECEPEPDVVVRIIGTDPMLGEVTADNGAFAIQKVPAGTYTLRALKLGFEAQELGVSVKEDWPATVTF